MKSLVKLTCLFFVCLALYSLCYRSAGAEPFTGPGEVMISKALTDAGAAYSAYYRALMNGDLQEARKLVASVNHKEFDSSVGEKMVEYFQKNMPRTIRFIEEIEKGKKATLVVEGKSHSGRSRGTIVMKLEENRWKVVNDKWKL